MSESKKYITALPRCSPVIIVSLSSAASNYAASANTGLGLIAHYTLHNWEHDKLDPLSCRRLRAHLERLCKLTDNSLIAGVIHLRFLRQLIVSGGRR